MQYELDYLAHHGVKGMKWGVRRTPEQLGRKTQSTNHKKASMTTTKNTYFDSLEFKKNTTDAALYSRINKIRDWETDADWYNAKKHAGEICRDVIMTRQPSDRHKFLQRLSSALDASVYDDPGVMAVNKQTGDMRYNSCMKFDLNKVYPDFQTGLYDTNELDRILGHTPGSTYYYVWGDLQNRE